MKPMDAPVVPEKSVLQAGMPLSAVFRLFRDMDPLELRILAGHALQLTRVQLITQSERELSAKEAHGLQALIEKRRQGEPIAYLVGEREFYGLSLKLTPDVLIPRPETELLVELALTHVPKGGRLLDLGTGSGAIAIAVAHERPDVQVTAVDISEAALQVAQDNARRYQHDHAPVHFLKSNWFSAMDETEPFHVIVSNPPYIAAQDRHLEQGDLRFEPRAALTDGADGLHDLNTLVTQGAAYLQAGGWLLMEHGYDQALQVREQLRQHAWHAVQSWRDLAGIERVSGGQKPWQASL